MRVFGALFLLICISSLLFASCDNPLSKAPQASQTSELFVVGLLDGTIKAYLPTTGDMVWSVDTGSPVLSYSNSSDLPFIPSLDLSLFVYVSDRLHRMDDLRTLVDAAPFVTDEGTLITGHKTSATLSIDPKTGAVHTITQNPSEQDEEILSTTSSGDAAINCTDLINVVRVDHSLQAQNASGESWRVTVAQFSMFMQKCATTDSEPRLNSPFLPSVNYDGSLIATDPLSGAVVWRQKLPSPVVNLYALQNREMNLIKHFVESRLGSAPSSVFIARFEGMMYAYPLDSRSAIDGASPHETESRLVPYEKKSRLVTENSLVLKKDLHMFPLLPANFSSEPSGRFLIGNVSYRFALALLFTILSVAVATIVWVKYTYKLKKLELKKLEVTATKQMEHMSTSMSNGFVTSSASGGTESTAAALTASTNSTQSESAPPPPLPPLISRYRKDFEELEQLGAGGFGVVYKVQNRLDGVNYAVKKVCLSCSNESDNQKVLREVRYLAKLDHTNVIRYFNSWSEEDLWTPPTLGDFGSISGFSDNSTIDASNTNALRTDSSYNTSVTNNPVKESRSDCECGSTAEQNSSASNLLARLNKRKSLATDRRQILYIQMQLCELGTLQTWMSAENRTVNKDIVLNVFRQLVTGVSYIHASGLIHRDLKPSNCMIAAFDGDVPMIKICDMGLCTPIHLDRDVAQSLEIYQHERYSIPDLYSSMNAHKNEERTAHVGSPMYMSPEQLDGKPYNEKADVFSLGIILFEMMHVFGTQMERIVSIKELREGKVPATMSQCWPNLVNLILQLVAVDPTRRPSASKIQSILVAGDV